MPRAPRSLCACGGIKENGVCTRCGPARKPDNRTGKGGVYDSKWKKKSRQSRQNIPVCIPCWHKGLTTLEKQSNPHHTHHIEKVENRPDLRLDDDNLIVTCPACHKEMDSLYDSDRKAYDALMVELKRVRSELGG